MYVCVCVCTNCSLKFSLYGKTQNLQTLHDTEATFAVDSYFN